MNIKQDISNSIKEFASSKHSTELLDNEIQLSPTKAEFDGDTTLVCFPLLRKIKMSPEALANEIGEFLKENNENIADFNVVKGFLNLSYTNEFWSNFLNKNFNNDKYGHFTQTEAQKIVLEYSSPNTNKPLHLGHIRNNLLGYSLSRLLKQYGYEVIRTNLVNDRGIHICKSMLAWIKYGNGETPESANMKGDHLIGKYYVKFDVEYKKEIEELIKKGMSEEEASKQAPLILEAQELLRQWEAGDKETVELWKKMNQWVYDGFDVTYKQLGIEFDKIYYESETYELGRAIVEDAFQKGIFTQREDKSIWCDLTDEGLDEKLLLRSDGTSVYMTQDLGTAKLRAEEFNADKMVYVVGNEQNYHFDVLKLILHKKLGFDWGEGISHMSYGMVELPSGKMKSREGTVVDADDLMSDMIALAKETTMELGKIEDFESEEAHKLYEMIGLGALKYFILKVDPKKNMMFDPKQSIDFNGNTASFIQYTHARISSILRRAKDENIDFSELKGVSNISKIETEFLNTIFQYPEIVAEAAKNYSPALIANYTYEFAKKFNQFYHQIPILRESEKDLLSFRLKLSSMAAMIIKNGMWILGIDVPEKM